MTDSVVVVIRDQFQVSVHCQHEDEEEEDDEKANNVIERIIDKSNPSAIP